MIAPVAAAREALTMTEMTVGAPNAVVADHHHHHHLQMNDAAMTDLIAGAAGQGHVQTRAIATTSGAIATAHRAGTTTPPGTITTRETVR